MSRETAERPRALVTGATRSIGLTIARRLARRGYEVLVNGRDKDAVAAKVEALRADGLAAMPCPADITSENELLAALEQVDDGVSVLVNNAVQRSFGDATTVSLADWSRCLDVTLTGALIASRCVLPGMRARGHGRIVNIVGMTGQAGAADRIAVVTAKSGLIGLTKAMALDEAAHGITVNGVSPGPIDTDRAADAEQYRHVTPPPVGRLGQPDEIAAAVEFLVSETGYLTGQILSINGGAHL